MADSEPDEESAGSPGAERDRWPAGLSRWRQDQDQTRADDLDPRRTHRERPAQEDIVDPRRTYREGPDDDDQVILGLPRALRSRYQVLEELPNPGAEADVLLVRDTAADPSTGQAAQVARSGLAVVKLYRRNTHADHAVWAKLGSLTSDDIVRIAQTGTSGGRDYEVMEYLPGGNLTRLADGRRALPLSTVTEVVRQVAGALAQLHGLGIVHRDLKPENVLIRRTHPLDVVVTDFGLSRAPEQSVVAASRSGTLAYLAPETLLHKGAHSSQARDWWALGMIVRELLTGVRPFEEMTEAGIHQALLLRPVDLGDIGDPRALLVCRGLLHRDPAERWGARQVHEWLAGGTPAVAAEPEVEASGIKPFRFQQVAYRDRPSLARAFIASWDEAARRYFVVMGTASAASSSWRELPDWLGQFPDVAGEDRAALTALIDGEFGSSSLPPDVKLLSLIQWLDPDLPPVYRGESLDAGNLAALAERVALDPDADPRSARLVGDLRGHDLLPRLARMRGGGEFTEVAARWRELDTRFGQRARESGPALSSAGRQAAMDADNPRRQAALLFLALDPQPHAARLRQHAARLAALLPAPVPWFGQLQAAALERADPVDDALLVTLFPLAAPESAAADQARRQQEEAVRRSEDHWAERERQRLDGNPGLPRARIYSGAVAGVMVLMYLVMLAHTASGIATDVVSALVGVTVTGIVFVTETNLAVQLGSDYASYPPTGNARGTLGQASRRVGAQLHRAGAGGGCLALIVGFLVLAIVVVVFFQKPYIGFAIIGAVHGWYWQKRRKTWLVEHEQEHAQILERAS